MVEKLSVIVPAFNEGSKICSNLLEMVKVFDDFGYDFELIVVNDGSTDNTYGEVLKAVKKDSRIRVLNYKVNKGKGHAVVRGVKKAKGDFVTFLDADLEICPKQLINFFKYMENNGADVVIGSKRHKDSIVNYPFHRRILSNCYYLMNKLLFNLPVKDTQSGLKLYKASVLKRVVNKIVVKGYAFDLEILVNVNRNGCRIVECPILINYSKGFGRIGLNSIRNILLDTLGIFYRLHFLKYYD